MKLILLLGRASKTPTARKEVAVSDSMRKEEFVVALVDDELKRFGTADDVPKGAAVFSTEKDFLVLTKKRMEEIYEEVRGVKAKFKDKSMGAQHLAEAAVQMSPSAAQGRTKRKYERRSQSTFKVLPRSEDHEVRVQGLPPQARSVYEILEGGGKSEYSEDELKALVDEKKDKLRTRQKPWRIVQYYRSELIARDLIRVV